MSIKTFVSGGGGFLGKKLIRALRERNWLVHAPSSTECDLCRPTDLFNYSTERYDLVFHLAAWTQAGDFCLTHPGEQWLINQKINTNMLDWWHCKQAHAKLIFIGTSCAYAEDSDYKEENYMLGTPIQSLYTYAMTKRMLCAGAQALSSQYGHKWLCAVPSTLYGADYHTDGRQMHFIFDLVGKILRGKHVGEQVTLWGDGYQRRELIHVDDFVRTLLLLAQGSVNQIINIGAGEDYTIRDFAIAICEITGFPFREIRFDDTRYVGARSKRLNIERLQRLYPEFSASCIDLTSGLKDLIRWFEDKKAYLGD